MLYEKKHWHWRLAIALVIAVIMWLVGWVTPPLESDIGQGVLAGFLSYFVLEHEGRRIRDLRRQLKVEEEFNHHARNALHVILMAEHCPTDNHSTIVIETAERLVHELAQISGVPMS